MKIANSLSVVNRKGAGGAQIIPTLSYWLTGDTLPATITYTGSNGTYFDGEGVLQSASHNLLLQSEDFATSWTAVTSTITTNQSVSPNGNLAGDLVTATGSSGGPSQTVTISAGATVTVSCFIKRGNCDFARFRVTCNAEVRSAWINLATGAAGTTEAGGTFITSLSSSVQDAGNGWYRFSLVCVTNTGTTFATQIVPAQANGGNSVNGDTTNVWGAQLEVGATPTNYLPTTTAARYQPRFDHDPVTLEPKGLLIEESRQNLLTYSTNFSNAAWTKITSTISSDAAVSPSGAVDADLFIGDSGVAGTYVTQNISTTAASVYTFSFFAKAGQRSIVRTPANGTAFTANIEFNLSTGVSSLLSGSATYGMTPVGNGWYRCYSTETAADSSSSGKQIRDYLTGDGVSGFYIWGAQLELGAFLTSYIPTTTVAVTRTADVATMTGANFSSWFNATEGTFVADVSSSQGNGARAFTVSDGTITNQFWIREGLPTTSAFEVYTSGAFVAQIGVLPAQPLKIAASYKANDFAVSVNGGTIATDTVGAIGTYSQMNIGSNYNSSGSFLNGHIRRISYYNTALTDAQHIGLSA